MKRAAAIAASAALAIAGGVALNGDSPASTGCVRAPLDGGVNCLRRGDAFSGGTRYFGAGNAFPAADATGAGCEPCPCSEPFGVSR